MYTELLAEGLVTDAARRQQYYELLHLEARRLGHLVENVLAYARLEGGRSGARVETITAAALFERVKPRLEQRTAQAGIPLAFAAAPGDLARAVRVDVAAVEQILFNLVDNACKYAVPRGASAIRIEMGSPAPGPRLTYLRVCDDGPGVPSHEARRLFRPFHKSASDAAHSAPGVGLGLAFSRRLARVMGGDLRLENAAAGACFVLTVPAA
jgi:signal transduction histidine kinase